MKIAPHVQISLKKPFLHFWRFVSPKIGFWPSAFWVSRSGRAPRQNVMAFIEIDLRVQISLQTSTFEFLLRFASSKTDFRHFAVKSQKLTFNSRATSAELNSLHHCKR
jgi:hypothetical protein